MTDKPFVAILTTLLLLLAAASWQFYSLMWIDEPTGTRRVTRTITDANHPLSGRRALRSLDH